MEIRDRNPVLKTWDRMTRYPGPRTPEPGKPRPGNQDPGPET